MASIADETILQPDEIEREEDTETMANTPTPKFEDTTNPGNSATKSVLPPKRPLTTGAPKRLAALATSNATKPTVASTRASTGSTISKPPTRPPVTSVAARRPPVVSSSTPLSERSRTSTVPIENVNRTSGTASETKRAMAAGTARRASLVPPTASKSESITPVLARRTANTGIDAKASVSSTRPSTTARQSTLSTPRTARSSTLTSNSPRPGTALDSKKRLSTIPASPAAQPSPATTRLQRPGLGQRKSTMSLDLQQKLREMELVHQMLSIAMAQDGDEDDELKAEYNQKMDKSIAELRTQLEESRAAEGLPPVIPATPTADRDPNVNEKLETDATQTEIKALEAELQDLKSKLVIANERANESAHRLEAAKSDAHEESASKINDLAAAHLTELNKLKDEIKLKDQNFHREKSELQVAHDTELEDFRAQLSEKDSLHQQQLTKNLKELEDRKAASTTQTTHDFHQAIKEQKERHLAEIADLRQKLESEQEQHSHDTSKLDDLADELNSVKQQLELSEKTAAANASSSENLAKSIEDKELIIREKENQLAEALSQLESPRKEYALRLEEIQAEHQKALGTIAELETKLRSVSSEHKDASEKKHIELQVSLDKIKALEGSAADTLESHRNVLEAKTAEIQSSSAKIAELIASSSSLASEFKSAVSEKDSEIASIQARTREFEQQAKLTATEHEEAAASWSSKMEALQNKIIDLESAALSDTQLREISDAKDGEITTLHNKIKTLEGDKTTSEDDKNAQLAAKDTELAYLQSKIEAIEQASLASVQELTVAKNTELARLSSKFEELEEQARVDLAKHTETTSTKDQQVAELQAKIRDLETAADHAATKLQQLEGHKDSELEEVRKQLDTLTKERDHIKESEQHSQELLIDHKTVKENLEEAISAVTKERDAFKTRLEEVSAQAAEVEPLNKQIDELKEAAEMSAGTSRELQRDIENRNAAQLEELRNQHITILNSALSASKDEHDANISSLQDELQELKNRSQKLDEALSLAKTQLSEAHAMQTTTAQQAKESQDEIKQNLNQAISENTDLQKKLEDQTNELKTLKSTHADSLSSLKEEHTKSIADIESHHSDELDSVKAGHASQMEELNIKHSSSRVELESVHAHALNQLQTQLEKSITDAETAKGLTADSHAANVQGLIAKHTSELEELREQLEQSKLGHTTAHEKLELCLKDLESKDNVHATELAKQEKLHQELKVKIAELSGQLNKSENANGVQLQSHQAEIAELSQKADEMRSSTEAAITAHEVEKASLVASYESRIADFQSQAEKHEKQRQAGAEVRDKLVLQLEELEAVRQSLPLLEGKVTELQHQLESSEREIRDLRLALDNAHEDNNGEHARHDDLKEEIQALRNELDRNNKNHTQNSFEIQKVHDSLHTTLVQEQAENATLKQQLDDATDTVLHHAARVREVEASLEAATAEIAELKMRARGPKTPAWPGIATSRWASDENAQPQQTEDIDDGAEVQGALASIQAQLKALQVINDDMMDDHQRMVTNIYNPSTDSGSTKASPPPISAAALSPHAPAFQSGTS